MGEEKEKKGGCLKGCLATLGIIFLILIIGAVAVYLYRDKIISRGTKYIEVGIMNQLPQGIDKKEVEEVFAQAREAIKEGRVDDKKLKAVFQEYREAYQDRELSEKEAREIIKRFREAFEDSGE